MVTQLPSPKPNPGFFVELIDYPPGQKQKVIMALRKLTDLNMYEAEKLIMTMPIVLEFGSELDGENAATALARAGAECAFGAHESHGYISTEVAQTEFAQVNGIQPGAYTTT
jgi:hypothetical protein